MNICTVSGCSFQGWKGRLCSGHRKQLNRFGSIAPYVDYFPLDETGAAKFNTYIHPVGDCWEWSGMIREDGSGRHFIDGVTVDASKMAYSLANSGECAHAPIGSTCGNAACVNPIHMHVPDAVVVPRVITSGKNKYIQISAMSPFDIAKFESKVDRSSGRCWEFDGYRLANGYKGFYVEAHKQRFAAHRVMYFHVHGEDPGANPLDHVCHNTGCVNPDHLRRVTPKQNSENLGKLNSRNTSGYRGVSWDSATKRWTAQIQHEGKTHYLGQFDTAEEADIVATSARLKMFTHNEIDRAVA